MRWGRRLVLAVFLAAGVLPALSTGVAVASSAAPAAERFALLIGVDRFEGRTRPNYGAVTDVGLFRQALVQSGWRAENIRVLTDSGARAADIREGLRWLVERSTPSSFTVMHYSGHVKQTAAGEFLWPHDNRFIPDTELASEVRRLRGSSWVDISGCEAAGFDEGISGPTRLFTASSRSTEKSYELVSEGKSVFTKLLVEQGLLGRQGDANGDGKVSVQEAFRYAAPRAPEITRSAPNGPQHPVMTGGDGDVFLAPPPPPPPPPRRCGINLLGLCLF